MTSAETTRTTTAIVDHLAPSGRVFVHEVETGRPGFLANTTPTTDLQRIERGQRILVEVRDSGDVMVVVSARPAA